MKRTVLLLIVSLFIVGTLAARVTVPENVKYEVPEPEPESVTDVTEEPKHTSDAVGPAEEKSAETVDPTETDNMSEDEGEIDLLPVPSDVEENPETKDEPVGTETTETSERPEAEVTEASVEIEPEITEEVSQPEDESEKESVKTESSEEETSTDVVAQDVVSDEGNEPIEMNDEIVTVDETSEVTGVELTEASEQPSAETEEVSVETEPEAMKEVSQPEDASKEDSVDIESSENETDADVTDQDLIPVEENEPTEIGDGIVTIDETSDTVVNEDSPVERSRMKLLVGMEAAHFAWNIGGGRQVAGYPLPCSGIFVAGLFDDRYILGTDVRVSYPVNGTTTNANFEVLGRFGMLSPLKRFSNDESVFFAEGDLLLGTAVRSNAGDTSIDPVVGLAGRIHLGKEFLTMAIGTDVMVMFPISGADQNPSYTIRPNLSLMWIL